MSQLFPHESAHWYTSDGLPRYEATLREARKEHLLPSITTVEHQEITSHQLYTWNKEQLILSALTLQREEGESLDAFAKRVVEDSQSEREKSATFGTVIHKLINDHLRGTHIVEWDTLDERTKQTILPVWKWIDDNLDVKSLSSFPFASETVFVNIPQGYAGRVDFFGYDKNRKEVLIDWKTQWTKNGKIAHYDTWAIQLAAQAMAIGHVGRCMNVVISSREYGLIEPYEWPEDDIQRCRQIFMNALGNFRLRRKMTWDPASRTYC